MRIDGEVSFVRYNKEVAQEWRDDDAVVERVVALLRADDVSDHEDQLAVVDDTSGYAAYAGGISRTTLMDLQSHLLNVPGDGILRNY